jgi:hypothetical protein
MENWKMHPVHTDYEVSDLGRVRRRTAQMGTYIGKILTPGVTIQGYRHVKIGGKSRRVYVLVLDAFIGQRPDKCEARHLNDIKGDDRLENLVWGTHAENYADRITNGGGNHGSRHGLAKLSEVNVASIRARYIPRIVTQKMLAVEFGVTRECVKSIIKRQRWAHI